MRKYSKSEIEKFLAECEQTCNDLKDVLPPLTYKETLQYLQIMAERQSIMAAFMCSVID